VPASEGRLPRRQSPPLPPSVLYSPAECVIIQALSQNVAAGRAVNNPSVNVRFPTGDSDADKRERIQASLVTLQNLQGPGIGCPAASTTLLVRFRSFEDVMDVDLFFDVLGSAEAFGCLIVQRAVRVMLFSTFFFSRQL
jgi:hypothetical protein